MRLFLFSLTCLLLTACGSDAVVKKPVQETIAVGSNDPGITAADTLPQEKLPAPVYPKLFYDAEIQKFGFSDSSGKVVIPATFDFAGEFGDGLAPVIKGNLHGFIDTNSTWKFKTKSELLKECNELSGECWLLGFENNRAPLRNKNGEIGYIDREGKVRIPFKYERGEMFHDGFAIVYRDSGFAYTDTSGNEMLFREYSSLSVFNEGRAIVVKDSKTGFINRAGKLVIPCTYESAALFSEGIAFVTNDPNYTNFFGIDTTGKILFNGPFERASNFINGKAVTSQKGKCIEIDRKGKKLRNLPDSDCPEGC